MKVTIANGRGTCGRCYKPIMEDSKQLVFSEGSYPYEHRYCKECAIKYLNEKIKEVILIKNCIKELKK